jgi:hypothetical protein
MRAAAAELAGVGPDGARFATQRDFPGEIYRTGVGLGVTHVVATGDY